MSTPAVDLAGMVGRQAREFQGPLARMGVAWEQARQGIQGDLDALLERIQTARDAGERVNPAWLTREGRYRAAMVTADRELARYAGRAAAATVEAQQGAVRLGVQAATNLGQQALMEAGMTAGFQSINPDNLRHLVGFLADGSPVADLFRGLGALALKGAREALTHGLVLGRGIDRIRRDLERGLDLPRRRAEVIARTESQRVFRAASQETYLANDAVLEGWTWHAALTKRTCPACIVMHGTVHPNTETLDGHPNCRCAMVPRTRSWEDLLGPDAAGIPDTRPDLPSGKDWLRAQSPADQRAILGNDRYEAMQRGEVDLDDLVARPHDDRWGSMRRDRTLREIREGRNGNTMPRRPEPRRQAPAQPRQSPLAALRDRQRPQRPATPAQPPQAAPARPVPAVRAPEPRRTLTPEQYEVLRPARSGWSAKRREAILETLSRTPEGKVLADTLARFQDGGSISRLRKNIDKRLAGETIDPTSTARVDSLLGAIRDAPTEWAPKTLYRGMGVEGTPAEVMARYAPGSNLDLSLTSFTTDRSIAQRFAKDTTSRAKPTRVTVEWVGEGKRAIPIQDLPKDHRLAREKEWVTAGRYRVVAAKMAQDGSVLVRIEQVGTP